MYGHRKLLNVVRRFDVLRPARTVQNESRQGAGLSKKLLFRTFARGQRPDSARPRKVATVTRSWHSLLENYAHSAWQPRATFNLCSRKPGCDSSRSRAYRGWFGGLFFSTTAAVTMMFRRSTHRQRQIPFRSRLGGTRNRGS
jgi:hypothetical protein